MEGYCKIERRMTLWKRLPNGKYICVSGNCSHAGGQYDKPPKEPKQARKEEYKYLKLEGLKSWK